MSYEATTWKKGDKITSAKLNNIESGIAAADAGIATAQAAAEAAQQASTSMVGEVEQIKTAAEEMKNTVEGNSAAVAEAKEAADAASAAAGTNATSIEELTTTVSSFEENISNAASAAATAGETATAAKEAVDSMTATVEELSASVTSMKEEVASASSDASSAKSDAASALSAVEANATTIQEMQTAVEEATSAASTANETASSAASTANAASESAEATAASLTTLSQTVEGLNTSVESISAAQTTMGETLTSQGESISSLEEKSTTLGTSVEQISTDVTALKEKDTEFETALENTNTQDSAQNGQLSALLDRLSVMESKVSDLQKTNKTDLEITGETGATISEPDADLVITTAAPITAVTAITAKSIDVKSMAVSSSRVSFTSPEGDISLANVKTDGDLPKATANAAFSLNTDGYVRITGSEFKQTGYNCIEIGLSAEAAPKNVLIDGLEFDGELSNNAILIFAHAPNAVITISNCHFASVSNMLRISNRNNVPAVVNISNCTIDKWDTNPEWAGALIFQDYNATTVEELAEANRFGDGKIKINFINVVGPHGKIMGAEDLSTILGSGDADKQIACMYANAGDTITPYAGHENMWPTFTFA